MIRYLIYGLIYFGAALMIVNIYGFIQFARFVRGKTGWSDIVLYVPIVLLVLFFIGYSAIALFGHPDLIVAGILFGGSIFVCIIWRLLDSITRKVIENERLKSELRATEESNKAKTTFLSSISHEMRTPMNVILGLDTLALRNQNLQEETRRQLEKIGLSAQHLMGLINNILDLNRIETGHLIIKTMEFSLKEAMLQVDAIISTLCDEKGLEYTSIIPEEAAARYIGDETELTEVLISVLDNAVKYTEAPGNVRFELEITPTETTRHMCRFTVTDTGIGIDPEFLPRIFDAFEQEDSSSTNQFGGSGLSLAVAKKSVDLLGGTITVESEKGKGSVFVITVPLVYAGKEEKKEQKEEGGVDSLEGRRILIVEDNPENAEIVEDLLELEGVETEHAENGLIAVEMMERSEPGYYDAILMDLRMPVMDGLEAAGKIRALQRPDAGTIPIIALTANAFESDVKASLNAGMNTHLAKPAEADLLFDTLKKLIK